MTQLKPYPEYKDSGAAWLGAVPAHWRLGRIAYAYSLTLGKMVNSTSGVGEPRPYLRAGNVQDYGVDLAEVKEMPVTAAEALSLDLRAGDVVIVEGGAGFGRSDYLKEDLIEWSFQNHVIRARALGDHRGRYLDFFIKFLRARGHFESLGSYATIPNVSAEKLGGIELPFLPAEEQKSIARFLDRETAEIDAFVVNQEELVTLLAERREATISHAVTKGLDPMVRMQNSGVEWLGEVPAAWTTTRLKHVGRSLIGLTYSPNDLADADEPGSHMVLRSGNIQHGQLQLDTDVVRVKMAIPPELVTQPADLLVCARNGSRALVGKNAFIGEAGAGQTFGAFMSIVRSEHNQYFRWVLNSSLFASQMGLFSTSTVNQLTKGTLDNFEFPWPPASERAAISNHLDRATSEIDAATADAREAIALSKERRAALISAAVTGKIDVRGVVGGTA